MPHIKILSETAISSHQLKKELEKIKKRDGELNYRANKTVESLNALIPSELYKKSDEIFERLSKLSIPRLKDSHLNKLIEITPKSIKEVKAILQGYSISLTNEQVQKIVEVFKEFVG